jgi:hypothetical protein
MPQGLQIFDNSGALVLDTNTRVTRILGTAIVSENGSMYVATSPGGRLFAYVVAGDVVNVSSVVPVVVVSGNTISWYLDGTGEEGAGSNVPGFGYRGKSNRLIWGEF